MACLEGRSSRRDTHMFCSRCLRRRCRWHGDSSWYRTWSRSCLQGTTSVVSTRMRYNVCGADFSRLSKTTRTGPHSAAWWGQGEGWPAQPAAHVSICDIDSRNGGQTNSRTRWVTRVIQMGKHAHVQLFTPCLLVTHDSLGPQLHAVPQTSVRGVSASATSVVMPRLQTQAACFTAPCHWHAQVPSKLATSTQALTGVNSKSQQWQ